MTEYDFSPEAFDRYMATQRRIARWVDQTERHRGEFASGISLTPPVPPTVKRGGVDDYFGGTQKPSPVRPDYTNHRRHSSANVPGHKYAPPPIKPQYRYQSHSSGVPMAGPVPLQHYPMAPPPPPMMVVSPPRSRESQQSRKSQRSSTTYVVAPPPSNTPQYYPYPYPYPPPPPGFTYMAPAGPGQPAVLPPSAPANAPPQAIPYYNPHPSQPLRVPPYSQATDPNLPLAYSYSAPAPFASSANTPPNPGSAAQYLPPHILYQRLHEIGRNYESRRSRSSSSDSERGRSSSRDSRDRSRSRGRSRTRKFWWNFS